jgi:hypothetical protein
MTVAGIVIAIMITPWAWFTGRMSVLWKLGNPIRVGKLYPDPVTRLWFHNLPTFSLPVLASFLLSHWALSPLALLLGWGAFFSGSRHAFRSELFVMAEHLVRNEGLDPTEALPKALEINVNCIMAKKGYWPIGTINSEYLRRASNYLVQHLTVPIQLAIGRL